MNFPLSVVEGRERDSAVDASGKPLLYTAWRAGKHLDKSIPISEAEQAADATARETLKELVRLANVEALRLGWYKV